MMNDDDNNNMNVLLENKRSQSERAVGVVDSTNDEEKMHLNREKEETTTTPTTAVKTTGYCLRWSRLYKTVEIKDINTGLLKSSIATSVVGGGGGPLSSSLSSSFFFTSDRRKSSSIQILNDKKKQEKEAVAAAEGEVSTNAAVAAGAAGGNDDNDDGGEDKTRNTSNQWNFHRWLPNVRKIDDNNSNDIKKKKVILDSVSGCALPGEIVAAMGPSGSGKTSLLNILSGRSSYDNGTISINGEIMDNSNSNTTNNNTSSTTSMKRLMSKIAYVKQADIFFQHLTVRDQFTYTAILRLPSTMSTETKIQEVDRIITLLRLTKVSESPIKMLSGGETKRVNIGTELLTDPAIILLDEPTSGLDSTSAVSLLQLLHRLARGDANQPPKTVITSIHQPSSAVFRSFDKLLMLSDGKVVYFGSPVESLDYLRMQNLACPDGYNAADHWMDLLVIDDSPQHTTDSDIENNNNSSCNNSKNVPEGSIEPDENDDDNKDKDKNQEMERLLAHANANRGLPRIQLQRAWDNEAIAEQMDAATEDIGETSKSASTIVSLNDGNGKGRVSKYNSSWTTQYWVLTHRCMKNSRSAIFTPLNLTKSVCIGLVAGMLWWQMEYTEARVHDRSSYFFFTMTYWVFDSMMGALMAFPTERKVILKERASGSYHLSAYFLAKTSSDAPVRLTLPFLYMCVSYWMAGVDNRVSVFLATTCCTLLSVTAGEAIGLLVGTSIHDLTKALTVGIVCGLGLMLLGGFYVQNIPSFVAWVKYLSPFKYAFAASQQIVFADDVPCDGSGDLEELCGGGNDFGVAEGEDVISYLGIQGTIGFNVGMLLLICFIPRYGAYLALRTQKGGERS